MTKDSAADRVLRFLLQAAPVRGEIVQLENAWREVVSRHALPAAVRDRLGELSAAALLLAATLKFDGALVLQIHGDGPVALFVVECLAEGRYRATVKLREDAEAIDASASLAALVDVHGGGRFVVTLDPRNAASGREPWQGIVPLDGDSVAAVLERYMLQSEQLPTRMWLAANAQRAVGLLLQQMPPAEAGANSAAARTEQAIGSVVDAPVDDDAWERMQHLAATITRDELLSLDAAEILNRLFWQERLHAFDSRAFWFGCNCSRDKVLGMMKLLGKAEVDSIVRERGEVEVRCDFCNQLWRIDAVDCALLFAEGASGGGELGGPPSGTLH